MQHLKDAPPAIYHQLYPPWLNIQWVQFCLSKGISSTSRKVWAGLYAHFCLAGQSASFCIKLVLTAAESDLLIWMEVVDCILLLFWPFLVMLPTELCKMFLECTHISFVTKYFYNDYRLGKIMLSWLFPQNNHLSKNLVFFSTMTQREKIVNQSHKENNNVFYGRH